MQDSLSTVGKGWVLAQEGRNLLWFYGVLAGLYLQFHLYAGGAIAFPFIVSNLIGLLFFFRYISTRDAVGSVIAFYAFFVFTVVFLIKAGYGGYFSSALTKHVQLFVSMFAAFGICTLMLRISRDRLSRHLRRLAIGILVVAFAERYLGFYTIMLEINSFLYMWRPQGFYIDEGRDLALWGAIRPLVFGTEPSLVGIWGSVLMIGSTMLSTQSDWRRYGFLVAYIGALLLISRSTTSSLILVFYLIATLFDRRNSKAKQVMILLSSILLVAILTLTSATTLLGNYMLGTSFFARFLGPLLTSVDVIAINPLMGLGLGNEGQLTDVVMDVWQRTGMLSISAHYFQIWGVSALLTNNFFWNWINFGLLGGTVYFAIAFYLARQMGAFPILTVCLSGMGVWMTLGGFVDLRTWFFIYFFIACTMLFEKDQTVDPEH